MTGFRVIRYVALTNNYSRLPCYRFTVIFVQFIFCTHLFRFIQRRIRLLLHLFIDNYTLMTIFTMITLFVFLFLLFVKQSDGLQNFFASQQFQWGTKSASPISQSAQQIEDTLLAAIQDEGNRLSNSAQIASLVEQLELLSSIPRPAIAPEVYGRWRLVYTTNAGTSSPIQRKAVNTKAFPIYQDIVVNDKEQLLVNQVVQFSETFELCVSALASTAAYPLPELTERTSTGKVLGWNILGVSMVGEAAQPDPRRPDSRIDFVFDAGTFDWEGKIQIPYPVPFRLPLFRDWVKGWIDITWLSDRVRISRGNKGTTFVLLKESSESTTR